MTYVSKFMLKMWDVKYALKEDKLETNHLDIMHKNYYNKFETLENEEWNHFNSNKNKCLRFIASKEKQKMG